MNSAQKTDFGSLGLSPALVQVVGELGFTQPTEVQARSIPLLLQGKDLIGQSSTGSGKTAAFALPILEKLRLGRDDRKVQALVLCPTRELCAQVAREIRRLGRRHAGLQVLELAGGALIGPQFGALERGVHIVVGTPGRILDHLERDSLVLTEVETLVLDEADRMLEMGFQEDMARIVSRVPSRRQTVLFSATFPPTIEALSQAYQRRPIRVTVASETRTAPAIRQIAQEVEEADRERALLGLLARLQPESTIVFCNFKASVASVARALKIKGVSAEALHGDLEQSDRDRVMAKFRNRSIRVLVATDVAARGIDVADLDLAVNFELPKQPEIYVHRIGRTGRAGKEGVAVSFYSAREKFKLEQTERYTGTRFEIEKPELTEAAPVAIPAASATMRTLFISGGRKDKVRPGDLLGALTGEAAGLDAKSVGKIEIHDRFSYVAIAADVAEVALSRLREGRIKGRKFRVEAVR